MTGLSGAPALPGKAADIYEGIRLLPIVSPHGHCDPVWFERDEPFDDPAELLIIPDHYVFRMLYSQGVPLESLGIGVPAEQRDPRAIFRLFAHHWPQFLGTPSRMWLQHTFENIFGLDQPLSEETADHYYDRIASCLASEAFRPRTLFDQFNIKLLATTDCALDPLSAHAAIAGSSWPGKIIPTFRPDSVLNPSHRRFVEDVTALGSLCDVDIHSFDGYREALRFRRQHFIQHGATATDHDVPDLTTERLEEGTARELFAASLNGNLGHEDAVRFYGHMLTEMAHMSADDGLVMQIHAGSTRSTNRLLLDRFGPDMGADIPKRVDWVSGLDGLLNQVGNNPDVTVIVFTLDESTYARELAPMAGHWPALKLGPPWWFHDSLNGILRYFDQVVETAGYENLTGFNDDTRAFLSIPARHDLWRRGVSLHLAEQLSRQVLGMEDAQWIAKRLTTDLALESYRLGEG